MVDFDQGLVTLFAATRRHAPTHHRQERVALQTPEQTPEGQYPSSSFGGQRLINEAPANGGHTGASGSVWGEPVMGRETHHKPLALETRCVLLATPARF